MTDVNATEAARSFSDLLDAVEHRHEHFTVVRRGKAVAHLIPVAGRLGADVKAMLADNTPDVDWLDDLMTTRLMVPLEKRP